MTAPSSGCKVCLGQWPRPDHRIADCGLSVAYFHEDQFFPGWTVLAFKRHLTELYQLSAEERVQMIEEVTAVAKALVAVFQPVKVNYALLGNQLPHMHWHVVPRLRDDPTPLEAIWGVKHEPRRLSTEALSLKLAEVRQQLGKQP
jgi:diadenosine tetraphosphate (Ap4A) HIT family hydrolase